MCGPHVRQFETEAQTHAAAHAGQKESSGLRDADSDQARVEITRELVRLEPYSTKHALALAAALEAIHEPVLAYRILEGHVARLSTQRRASCRLPSPRGRAADGVVAAAAGAGAAAAWTGGAAASAWVTVRSRATCRSTDSAGSNSRSVLNLATCPSRAR